MPAKQLRPRCRHIFTLVAGVFLVPASVAAQTGRVSLQGTVSETVALSVPSNFTHGNIDTDVVSSGNTVRLTLSSPDGESPPVIRVPLLVRSNSGFKIAAIFESKTSVLTELSVLDLHATGMLVSAQAVNALGLRHQFDLRRSDDGAASAPSPSDVSQPLFVLSGPRVSLGGTLESSNNALQVTLLIRLQPQPVRGWLAQLTFVATPESPIR
ncbi:MAG TPA: hypothetical protein VGQ39_01450 [Pyrinomonadaceae bacterium]|jgi:hypothetical protein|nr:hypothetical protein [Pyrinomonadaceae bacterium]